MWFFQNNKTETSPIAVAVTPPREQPKAQLNTDDINAAIEKSFDDVKESVTM